MPKITKLCLHLLKLCRKNCGLFFPDTVYFHLKCEIEVNTFSRGIRLAKHLVINISNSAAMPDRVIVSVGGPPIINRTSRVQWSRDR